MRVSITSVATQAVAAAALSDTVRTAQAVAAVARPGDVIALRGNLGAGKSAFARAFIQARAGAAIEAPSPTFTLLQTYDLSGGTIWHFDLYRLNRADDVYELGWEEATAEGLSLVEWPERLGHLLPADALDVRIDYADKPEARNITLTGGRAWADRLPVILPPPLTLDGEAAEAAEAADA